MSHLQGLLGWPQAQASAPNPPPNGPPTRLSGRRHQCTMLHMPELPSGPG